MLIKSNIIRNLNKREDVEFKAENNSTFTFEYVGESASMRTPNSIIQMPDSKDGNNWFLHSEQNSNKDNIIGHSPPISQRDNENKEIKEVKISEMLDNIEDSRKIYF